MNVSTLEISVPTKGNADMIDITERIQNLINENGFLEGNAIVFVPGATGGVTTIEFEPGLKKDFPESFEKFAPSGATYKHDETWHDGNGHSHIRASMLGPSITIPFENKNLILGRWQQVVLLDFDTKPRNRRIIIQLMGVTLES